LRRRRRALGLTQEQAGGLLHRLAYHRIVTGARHISLAELGGICAAFQYRVGDLVHQLVAVVPAGPERTVSLRKSTEAKDAAVRAVAIPETA
jgi:hypothetical protein